MAKINVSDKLKLPLDVVTTATAVLGIRGSGKTNTGVVIVEDLLEAGQQVIVVDPLDVWWGLKGSADDKTPGYPITVIGGPHADVPMAETDGKVLADFLVDNPVPAVLSLRHLTKSASRRFMTDFAEQIYHRKGQAGKNTPVLMVVDEASLFCPQHVMGEMARLVGAIQSWVRQGRVAGIGCMLIDQRPATVNKDVLSQVELMVIHRLVSPQDRKALREWIDAHATAEQQAEFDRTVATLKRGEAWFWSPEWLGLFERVQVRQRRTFDSSATPKAGQKPAAPKKLAAVELDALRSKLALTIEKAKVDDPKELRRQIAELQKQAGVKPAIAPPERIEVPVLSDAALKVLAGAASKAAELLAAVQAIKLAAVAQVRSVPTRPAPAPTVRPAVSRAAAVPAGDGAVPKAQQRILDSLAWWETIGQATPERGAAAVMAGYTVNGHFNNLCGALRTSGLIDYPGDGTLLLSDAGKAAANYPAQLGTLADVHAAWKAKLDNAQWRLVEPIINAHPTPIEKEELAAAAGYTVNGHFNNLLGSLRSLGVVERRSPIAATTLLFPVGLS